MMRTSFVQVLAGSDNDDRLRPTGVPQRRSPEHTNRTQPLPKESAVRQHRSTRKPNLNQPKLLLPAIRVQQSRITLKIINDGPSSLLLGHTATISSVALSSLPVNHTIHHITSNHIATTSLVSSHQPTTCGHDPCVRLLPATRRTMLLRRTTMLPLQAAV
jgi:hypothetical protein